MEIRTGFTIRTQISFIVITDVWIYGYPPTTMVSFREYIFSGYATTVGNMEVNEFIRRYGQDTACESHILHTLVEYLRR